MWCLCKQFGWEGCGACVSSLAGKGVVLAYAVWVGRVWCLCKQFGWERWVLV